MIIGIEAQRLFRLRKHGMDMVVFELIKHLSTIKHDHTFFVYVAPGEDICFQDTDNIKVRIIGNKFYPYWEQYSLPEAAKKDGCQLLHCTSNTAPVRSKIPMVVTIHDMIFMESGYLKILTGKGTLYQRLGNVYRKINIPKIITKCEKIITVSVSEKDRLTKFFHLPDYKIQAIYNGVSSIFVPITDPERRKEHRKAYQLPEQYILHLGNTDPKKNTPRVIESFAEFVRKTNHKHSLVILDLNQDFFNEIVKKIKCEDIVNRIHIIGYVKNTDLPAIYSMADLFLYPSLRESFGIPMLEAMACKVPVIAGNTSSMPEVSGGAALLVDPFNTSALTEAMINLISDDVTKQDLIEKGVLRAAMFKWSGMTEKVLDLYNDVLNRKKQ